VFNEEIKDLSAVFDLALEEDRTETVYNSAQCIDRSRCWHSSRDPQKFCSFYTTVIN
jgi:hypothetical protein